MILKKLDRRKLKWFLIRRGRMVAKDVNECWLDTNLDKGYINEYGTRVESQTEQTTQEASRAESRRRHWTVGLDLLEHHERPGGSAGGPPGGPH